MCCCQHALHYTGTSFLGGVLEHPVSLRTINLALCACKKEENLFFIVKVVEFILLQNIIKKLFKKQHCNCAYLLGSHFLQVQIQLHMMQANCAPGEPRHQKCSWHGIRKTDKSYGRCHLILLLCSLENFLVSLMISKKPHRQLSLPCHYKLPTHQVL